MPGADHRGGSSNIDLLAHYAASGPVGFDEMMTPAGEVRAHYRPLIDTLATMTATERGARFASAEQYLREAGVFHRVYTGPNAADRQHSWPLAQPPLVITQSEWTKLTKGLIQRAVFLERFLADLYGPRRTIRNGILPGPLLGRNPEFLHPLAEQSRSGTPLLHFIAVDLGRASNGQWHVLQDRTQAPSGAGFSLENRVASSRAFPDLVETLPVRRIAGFFQRFRDGLNALTGPDGERVGVLSPGQHSDTYFEHAYLARYLGFVLLEGDDLAVTDDQVNVRTVDGLRRIKVLWRRMDADFVDPLELYPHSRIGTPGILRAVRSGAVSMVNALGSGILETPALMAFQAPLSQAILGEDLLLPTLRTWWGGSHDSRDAFRDREGDRSILAAFPPRTEDKPCCFRDDDPETPGQDWIAQERLRLSTAPTFVDGRLEPRTVTLRAFLARDEDGWHVMPGGFARMAAEAEGHIVSMTSGGRSLDVWIEGKEEAHPVTLLGRREGRFFRHLPGSLPARAADNLFWLGRYCERTEAATRLLRIVADKDSRLLGPDPSRERLSGLLGEFGIDIARDGPVTGLLTLARTAFAAASRIRDRFSPDGWRVLGEIVELIESHPAAADKDALINLTSAILTRQAGFAGLLQENMYQFTGWRFLDCGRRIERGIATARAASRLIGTTDAEGTLDALLDFTDSRVTYRRRYTVALSPDTVLDLTVLDPLNPRSVAFQAARLKEAMDRLPGVHAGQTLDRPSRRLARLNVRLVTGDPHEIDVPFLDRLATDFADISDLLAERYFSRHSNRHAPSGEAE